MTVPDLPVEAPQARAATSTTRSGQPASQRPTCRCRAATAFRPGPGPPGTQLHHLLGYYPSVHTATALVCTGLLLRFTRRLHPHWPPRLLAASTDWTLIVAASLVLHRCHWFTDVLAGLLLGTLILALEPTNGASASERRQDRFAPTVATCGSDVLRAAVTAGHERFGQSSDVGKEA